PVLHVEDLTAGPELRRRVPVTLQAPAHGHGLRLERGRHLVDPAVAARATDAVVHVNAVIEVDVVGQVVDAVPLHRDAGLPALEDGGQLRRVRPDLRVARHAGLGGWHRGRARRLDG